MMVIWPNIKTRSRWFKMKYVHKTNCFSQKRDYGSSPTCHITIFEEVEEEEKQEMEKEATCV